MMPNSIPTLDEVRRTEARIRNFGFAFVLRGVTNARIKATKHFREWFEMPMNYARVLELPLTMIMLEAKRGDRILDVSSPKLLALYLASKVGCKMATGDLEEYFVSDFTAYNEELHLEMETPVFNAAEQIPYADGTFGKAFSVSVLEHIAGDGDHKALKEMHRVVAPGGIIVITLPAFTTYVEEWISDQMYWKSVQDASGKIFFQRRYDKETLEKLIAIEGLRTEEVILVAEKPIKRPEIGPNGVMQHNSYLLDHVEISRKLRRLSARFPRIPFLKYFAEKCASKRCHYLTSDWKDENIRQVIVKLRKIPGCLGVMEERKSS